MKTLNLGVVMEQGTDFNAVIGIRGVNGPINITGYSFLGDMRLSTSPSEPIAGGVKASGLITLTANPAPGDTLTINGFVITFVAANPVGPQVLISSTTQLTAQNLYAFLFMSLANQILAMTYSLSGLVITATAASVGVAGNALTLAAVSAAITLSGATLAGGINAAEFLFTILDQATNTGQVKWSLPAAIVDTIGASISNNLQTKRQKTPYVFDIKMLDSANTVKRIIQGIIYFSPQATQGSLP